MFRSLSIAIALAAIVAGVALAATGSIRAGSLGRPSSHLPLEVVAGADEDFDPPIVKELDCRQFKPPGTPPFQYKIFTGTAECEIAWRDADYYMAVDFHRVGGRRIPVLVLASKHSVQTGRRILLLTGGPRGVLIAPDDVMKDLVEAGWTIFIPIYQGEADTAYPNGDSEEALKQIAAFRRLLLQDSDLVIGESAGGYLAAADCALNGGNQRRLLLAPLIRAPVDQYAAWKESADREQLAAGQRSECIPKVGFKPSLQVCAPDVDMQEAFWGKYRTVSVNDVLSSKPSCRSRTSIIISPEDGRVYSASDVEKLESSGVTIIEVPQVRHVQMENDKRVIELVRNWAERDVSWLTKMKRRFANLFSGY